MINKRDWLRKGSTGSRTQTYLYVNFVKNKGCRAKPEVPQLKTAPERETSFVLQKRKLIAPETEIP